MNRTPPRIDFRPQLTAGVHGRILDPVAQKNKELTRIRKKHNLTLDPTLVAAMMKFGRAQIIPVTKLSELVDHAMKYLLEREGKK